MESCGNRPIVAGAFLGFAFVNLVRGKMWLLDNVDLQAVDWDELPTGAVHFANSRRSGATQTHSQTPNQPLIDPAGGVSEIAWFEQLTSLGAAGTNSDLMIRLPILEDELAFLEKLLPDLETRPDLGHLAFEVKKRIYKIRQEIRALQEKG